MKTIDSISVADFEVNRSRFYAYLAPQKSFDTLRTKLRQEHPKANHIVWAYRFLDKDGRVVEASNDDGEPKGCAGRPMLNVLRGEVLVGCGALIVRYFGGIKLGTGGMARAYSDALKLAIQSSDCMPYEPLLSLRFHTLYEQVRHWSYTLQRYDVVQMDRSFDEKGVEWTICAKRGVIEALADRLEKNRLAYVVIK